MVNYILLSEKSWHKELFEQLTERKEEAWHLISSKADFNFNTLRKIQPCKIFIPHWSYIIPAEIYESYDCIVFHMTDLPYGRGGSPLQNLIVRGKDQTKISALKAGRGIDTGDIYTKKTMQLNGTATDILLRSVPLIRKMIVDIIDDELVPNPQEGEVVEFKRRTPAESDITGIKTLNKLYDHIRMLDGEAYPNAFIENEHIKIEFFNAHKNEIEIIAHVRITEK